MQAGTCKKSRLRRFSKPPPAASAPAALAPDYSGLTAFALRLTKELVSEGGARNKQGNLIFSPLSIYAALGLLAAGARGRTVNELLNVLGARSRDHLAGLVRGLAELALADQSAAGGPHVSFACGVWHDATRSLAPEYRSTAVQCFKAEARAVDFRKKPKEAVDLINKWVATATNNLITSIIDGAVPKDTDIILVNAVYFKGLWDKPFNKDSTKLDTFTRLDGTTVDRPFMRSRDKQYIGCHNGFKVLRLQYKQGSSFTTLADANALPPSRFSMCVFLPDAHDGLWALVDKIASKRSFLRDHLPTQLVAVGKFRLPKFTLTFSGDITKVVQNLGLHHVFDTGEADRKGKLALSQIVHKAIIEVNEEGTKAAAVTGMRLCLASPRKFQMPALVDFVADHPFAFFVIDEMSGAILFSGHVLEPNASS